MTGSLGPYSPNDSLSPSVTGTAAKAEKAGGTGGVTSESHRSGPAPRECPFPTKDGEKAVEGRGWGTLSQMRKLRPPGPDKPEGVLAHGC